MNRLGRATTLASFFVALGGCGMITNIGSFSVEEALDAASASEVAPAEDAPSVTAPEDVSVSNDAESVPDGGDAASGCTPRTAGPLSPTANAQSGGGNDWQNPTRVYAQDDSGSVSAPCCNGDDSKILSLSGFGFAIPSGAKVTGAKVIVRAKGNASDKSLRLTPLGAATGTDLASAKYTSSYVSREYGGENEHWGVPLVPAIVNDATFGVAFQITKPQFVNASADVDDVQMVVYYCE